MSDLQTALLGIGACVVAGVYAFNRWQERQFRRRTEVAFEREHDDVLMPAAALPPLEAEPTARIEPRLESDVAPTSAARTVGTRAQPLEIDSVIDFAVEVELAAPVSGAGLLSELSELAAGWDKPVLAAGYDAAAGEWVPLGTDSAARYSPVRFAVQMSNRAGCIGPEKLRAFLNAVDAWAGAHGAVAVKSLEVDLAHSMAVQLDRFCSDVDIAIGINVVTQDGNPFAGSRIRALAEESGMKLESDGVFYLRDDTGRTTYTLDNHEPMPFVPEQIKSLTTSGVTFLLDVPGVPTAGSAFESMLAAARTFALTLNGKLVDDNRSALSDDAIEKIRRQLTGILAKMEAGQIAAGGTRALRLFS
ncbi:MAG: ZipA FtsZ-binding region protein [Betaproteobacteria bacterium]|nr:ZipA FtsZ-binding region protein [Betaproteobacteria bacterium]